MKFVTALFALVAVGLIGYGLVWGPGSPLNQRTAPATESPIPSPATEAPPIVAAESTITFDEPASPPMMGPSLVAAFRGRLRIAYADVAEGYPKTTCMKGWFEGDQVCEIIDPPTSLCLAGIPCKVVGFMFRKGRLVIVRMVVTEAALKAAFMEASVTLSEPRIRRQFLSGPCTFKETAEFDAADAQIRFDFLECGDIARAYGGPEQAIVVHLSPMPEPEPRPERTNEFRRFPRSAQVAPTDENPSPAEDEPIPAVPDF